MLNFIKVNEDELVKGHKYKLIDIYSYNPHEYTVTFDGYTCKNNILIWINLSFEKIVDFEKRKFFYTTDPTIFLKLKYSAYVHELISSKEKIQNAMELRAINLILQNIIGDKLFTYL
jgi:hypothetical protein